MRKTGEFENRDAEELGGIGDLPEPLARERGEDGVMRDAYSRLPADMRRSEALRQSATTTPLGSPTLDYNVRGIFDSRPINGVDFSQSARVPILFPLEASIINEYRATQLFQVPAGKVLVMRRIILSGLAATPSGAPALSSENPIDFEIQLYKNGGVILPTIMTPPVQASGAYYEQGIPVKVPETVETFQIFDELETFGLSFLQGDEASPYQDDESFYCWVTFEGNMLVKTGIPATFEVANLAGRKPAQPFTGEPAAAPRAATVRPHLKQRIAMRKAERR